jgi:hypothetical protein
VPYQSFAGRAGQTRLSARVIGRPVIGRPVIGRPVMRLLVVGPVVVGHRDWMRDYETAIDSISADPADLGTGQTGVEQQGEKLPVVTR